MTPDEEESLMTRTDPTLTNGYTLGTEGSTVQATVTSSTFDVPLASLDPSPPPQAAGTGRAHLRLVE